jgi:hypothetical protein
VKAGQHHQLAAREPERAELNHVQEDLESPRTLLSFAISSSCGQCNAGSSIPVSLKRQLNRLQQQALRSAE